MSNETLILQKIAQLDSNLCLWEANEETLIITVTKPIHFAQIFKKVKIRMYENLLVIEGKGTLHSAFHLKSDRIEDIRFYDGWIEVLVDKVEVMMEVYKN